MGFFSLKATCAICNNEVGLNRFQLKKDVWICPSCLNKLGGISSFDSIKNMSIEELQNKIQGDIQKIETFTPTKKVGNYLWIDETHKQWAIPTGIITPKINNSTIYDYSDITSFELIEDGESITKGGLGRALAGGLVFGGAGAVVGGITGGKKTKSLCSKMQIVISLNNMKNPVTYINLISAETKKDGMIYKSACTFAQEILSVLQLICNSNKNIKATTSPTTSTSAADEIKKYKELLDMGAITQDEFDKKKQELLNL